MVTAFSYMTDFCSGRLRRRTLLRICFPLILASYFGSLALAIWLYPGPFDWRTKAMSKLLYPENNPHFHAIGSVGIATAGVLMLPFAGYIGRRLRDICPVAAEFGALTFGAGAISLILGALVVLQPYHEVFARSAGICVGVSILVFYLCAIKGLSTPSKERNARRRMFLAWSLIVLPALLIVLLRLLTGVHFRWSNTVYRALENRSLWHLGFWEWIISAAVFLFMFVAALILPENVRVMEPNGIEL
jgi:hypothetical protein